MEERQVCECVCVWMGGGSVCVGVCEYAHLYVVVYACVEVCECVCMCVRSHDHNLDLLHPPPTTSTAKRASGRVSPVLPVP